MYMYIVILYYILILCCVVIKNDRVFVNYENYGKKEWFI